jgi:hypothetical protein
VYITTEPTAAQTVSATRLDASRFYSRSEIALAHTLHDFGYRIDSVVEVI